MVVIHVHNHTGVFAVFGSQSLLTDFRIGMMVCKIVNGTMELNSLANQSGIGILFIPLDIIRDEIPDNQAGDVPGKIYVR